jgi:hypothetical protein
MTTPDLLTRREALARTALLVGGTLAGSTILGGEHALWAATPGWAPRTLSPAQLEMVATIAEHILPATDTPGARAAGVHRLVDVFLTEHYAPAERDRFLAGLHATNQRAVRERGTPFLRCSAPAQLALVAALDAEAFPAERRAEAKAASPEIQAMRDSLPRAGSTAAAAPTRASRDEGAGWFFRRMKELTLLGYYTSQAGATKELAVNPMGAYHGDLSYRRLGRGWA